MGANVEKNISYFLEVRASMEEQLSAIRHWPDLKVAFEEGSIWVTGFSEGQLNGVAVKSIPFAKRYFAQEGKLYLIDSRLPERTEPSLLWSPITRGLKVTLPKMNHNYFGVETKISVQLIASSRERKAAAMICSMERLAEYSNSAPQVRLEKLRWVILNHQSVILFGTPLLPLQGQSYWQSNDFLIPAGYDFDLPILSNTLNSKINPAGSSLVIWNKDASYFLIDKMNFRKLSLSSIRLSGKYKAKEE